MVTVEYDGCGDSGAIDSVSASTAGTAVDFPDTRIDIEDLSHDGQIFVKLMGLEDGVDMITSDLLAWHHAGWENGDGASGELTFHVDTEVIEFRQDARFTDYETFNYEF